MANRTSGDVTTRYLSTLGTTRRVSRPILVKEGRKPVTKTADEFEIDYHPEADSNHPYEKWRQNIILKFLATREISRYLDRKTFIAVSLREAVLHSIFLILLTIITFGSFSIDKFYLHEAMADLYIRQKFPVEDDKRYADDPLSIDFYQISTFPEMWFYMRYIMGKIYRSFWYSPPEPDGSVEEPEDYSYENKVIGSAQIRQLTVINETCDIYIRNMTSLTNHTVVLECFRPYSEETENKDGIPTPPETANTINQYMKWQSPSETGSMPISGSLATYSGGGYVALIPRQSDERSQLVQQLKVIRWIQRHTRAVFIEFTIYNANANLFCIIKLIFEIPSTGGVIPSHWNYVKKLIRYNDIYDFFILGCEIICLILFIFFTIQKALEIKTLKMKLFTSFWNYVDIMFLIMCYLTLIFNVLLYVKVVQEVPKLVRKENEDKYASFDYLLHLHILYSRSFAFLIAFAFLKLLKYLNIIHVMYELQSTISKAVRDALNFSILFFYLCFVFALIGQILFGSKLEDFHTFPMALYALLRMSIGDFDYAKLAQAEPVYGLIFFYLFIFLMVFTLAGIFLAILISRYKEVRSEVRIGGAKTFIGDMLKLWFLSILEYLECDWILSQIVHKDFEDKIRSPMESIHLYLIQAGYSELEIELFFKKYDITDSKIAALEEDRFSFKAGEREAPPPLSQKDIVRCIVIQKLEYLENHYKTASKLIDNFLSKLIKIEEVSRQRAR